MGIAGSQNHFKESVQLLFCTVPLYVNLWIWCVSGRVEGKCNIMYIMYIYTGIHMPCNMVYITFIHTVLCIIPLPLYNIPPHYVPYLQDNHQDSILLYQRSFVPSSPILTYSSTTTVQYILLRKWKDIMSVPSPSSHSFPSTNTIFFSHLPPSPPFTYLHSECTDQRPSDNGMSLIYRYTLPFFLKRVPFIQNVVVITYS